MLIRKHRFQSVFTGSLIRGRDMMSVFFIIKKVEHVTLVKMIASDVKPLKKLVLNLISQIST